MALCFVSIGSNVEREHNIRGAIRALHKHFGPLLVSSIYETPAIGFDGAPFYNLAAGFVSHLDPRQIAALLRDIETRHGRLRDGTRFGPRSLDIDLLLCGDQVLHDGNLELPRSEIERYAFVLEPIAEIAPDLRHPVTKQCYGELWRDFKNKVAVTTVDLALST